MFRISHWWLILLLHECCFTQSMTDCLRPACTHLLPLFLTLYTFFLRFTHFFLKYTLPHSQWDPKWGKHCSLFHLKIFLTHSYSWMIVCVLVAQSCLTLCDLMDCSSAGSSVHGILPEFAQKSCPLRQWCHPPISILCRPLLLPPLVFPSIKVFSNELVLRIRRPKNWSFSFSISRSIEYPGLISFRMDWLDLPLVRVLTSGRWKFFKRQCIYYVWELGFFFFYSSNISQRRRVFKLVDAFSDVTESW